MKTRMIQIIVCMAVAGTCVAAGHNDSLRGIYHYPQQERLRPMILPMKMWQATCGVSGYLFKNEDGKKYLNIEFDPGLAPRRSLSRRVEIPRFPWVPYVRILMTEKDIGVQPDGSLNRFAIVFEGGVNTFSFSKDRLEMLGISAAATSKHLLGKQWWHGEYLSFNSIHQTFTNWNHFGIGEIFGYQINDVFAVSAGLVGRYMTAYQDNDVATVNGLATGRIVANINKRISACLDGTFSGSKVVGGGTTVSYSGFISPKLVVQW